MSNLNPNQINFTKILDEALSNYTTIVIDFIMVNDTNQILIQKRSMDRKLFPGKWEMTGGKLEEGETIIGCIKREMFEECKMELTSILTLAHRFTWADDSDVINLQFLVKAIGEFTPEAGKISEHKWIGIDQIDILLDDNSFESDIYKCAQRSFEYLETAI